MSVNGLNAKNYYEHFERGGLNWDLRLMLSAFKEMPVLYDGTFDNLRAQPSANLLLLGSATAQNLDNMALMDRQLRPGLGDRDTVYIIDYNSYPLQKHQERIAFLAEWEESSKKYHDDAENVLPYPSFELAQADMKHLPFVDGSLQVAVSDYTLNFAESSEEVAQTFLELSRVLAEDGFLFFSVRGNPYFPYRQGDVLTPNNDEMAHKELAFGLKINRLPLATYLGIAQKHGLEFVAYDSGFDHSEILCGVLQKKSSVTN